MTVKKMSFIVAMRDYFSFGEGGTITTFMKELKALTVEDRVFFKKGLETVGYEIVE
jgi:hypothetical protein